jgi:signal transduction histidine kinase
MRLADFILQNMEKIMVEWEAFARKQLPAASHMTSLQLCDHGREILEAIARDLRTTQTLDEQRAKSLGLGVTIEGAGETAAQTHALLRAKSGFDVKQLVSEYRALRASVLRLWLQACAPASPNLDDMVRFNEAIDQALAESIAFFAVQVERARNLLLGMLGHDMRNPLQAIKLTAVYLGQLNAGDAVSAAAQRLIRSGGRMQALLDDLSHFTRTQLGLGIQVNRAQVDLAEICRDELDEMRTAYPDRTLALQVEGDGRGSWDAHRLKQLLGNLVGNALKYGASDAPVRLEANGGGDEVQLRVINVGQPIDSHTLGCIFEPLTRGDDRPHDPMGLGLGLYIASEIAKAHGGRIEAASDATQTVFTVHLPRSAS